MNITSHITCGATIHAKQKHTNGNSGRNNGWGKKNFVASIVFHCLVCSISTWSGIDDYLWLVSNSMIIPLAINIYTIYCWHDERKWASTIICQAIVKIVRYQIKWKLSDIYYSVVNMISAKYKSSPSTMTIPLCDAKNVFCFCLFVFCSVSLLIICTFCQFFFFFFVSRCKCVSYHRH